MSPTTKLSRWLALAGVGFIISGSPVLHAQTDGGPALSANTAAAWRASSRLGYAPTPALASVTSSPFSSR